LGRQVNHLVRLVDDLWEISRIGYGKIELKKERIDLCVTLRDAVDISRPFIEAGSHRLTVDSPSEPLLLDGDAVRLTQVFANLLNNAAKYTPPEGHIEILTKRDGDDAIICVRDTGMGIRAGMLPRVFDLFTQSSRALSHSHGGIGVGLALARSLIEMHGGQVEGHSEGVGRGSEFVVRLPLTGAMPENG
jgi:signal transduction histidine kinase